MTEARISEINSKEWYKMLYSQYKLLFRDKDKIKHSENLRMDIQYPLLLDFVNKVLAKLKETNT